MNDDYNYDELEDIDDIEDDYGDYDGVDDDDTDDGESTDDLEDRILEAEDKGYMDGRADTNYGVGKYTAFGTSLNENDVSDEEWEAYGRGYENGYN